MSNRQKRIDFVKLQNDPTYKNNYGWKLLPKNLAILQDSLINRGASDTQIVSYLSQVIPESGGATGVQSNGSVGLISRRGDRKINYPKTLPKQIHVEMESLFGPFQKNEWYHGGKGSGFNSGRDAQRTFQNTNNLRRSVTATMRGLVRPESEEYEKRYKFANFLKTFLK